MSRSVLHEVNCESAVRCQLVIFVLGLVNSVSQSMFSFCVSYLTDHQNKISFACHSFGEVKKQQKTINSYSASQHKVPIWVGTPSVQTCLNLHIGCTKAYPQASESWVRVATKTSYVFGC